jgi:phytoene dehydrogenase-like protein
MFFGFIEFKPYHLKGGSQALSNALADCVISNGGTVRYNCAAEKILVSDGEVRGVITEDGDEIATRYVVSNASKIATYMELIDSDQVPDPVINELRQSSVAQSGFVLFMGLDCDPGDVGFTESTNFVVGETNPDRSYEKMRDMDIDERDTLVVSCYDLRDPSFSPEGEKYRVADNMLRVVEMAYPDVRKHIEEFEVATPLTFMRYLGHPRGSIYGFDHFIKDSDLFVPSVPHIKGLFGVGGWFGLCGFQPTLESGVRAARAILKKMKA